MDLQPHPDDHEAKMARADLFKLAQYSFKLFKMIHEDMELEGWVQAKITKSADYIASVYHYMEYEMKFSEYGEKLENSDVYSGMSESQQRALTNMLTEAKATMKKLTAAQAKKLKKKDSKVEESADKKKCPPMSHIKKMCQDGKSVTEICKMHPDCNHTELKQMIADCKKKLSEAAKPDFLDMDKDGDKKEPMKKALKDKKVKEGFPTVDDAKKDHEAREKSKGTGKFDKKDTGTGTQYTRKASTFTDGGDDSDVKKAKKKAKQTDEGVMDTVKSAAKKVGKAVTGGSDEDQRKDLQRKMGVAQTGKKPAQKTTEAAKWRDPKHKDKLYTQEPRDEDDYYQSDDDYYNPKPDDYPGAKNLKGGGEFDHNDPLQKGYGRGGTGSMNTHGKRKGMPSRDHISSLKGSIKAAHGTHPRPNLPETAKAKKDYDGDGKIESGKDEYLGSRIAAAKKAGKMSEASKCNHSAKGKSCPVHGLKECGSMAYEGRRG
jgi:hypothetical protein